MGRPPLQSRGAQLVYRTQDEVHGCAVLYFGHISIAKSGWLRRQWVAFALSCSNTSSDHDPSFEPNGCIGPERDFLGCSEGKWSIGLPVAEERGSNKRCDFLELHHTSGKHERQRV